ncbi:ArsR/SmtB family transcription factor [Faucicola mancuniensis]|uniref:ArsR/SmtB family transcription factor n=1 Tax=Faucicola mancuniensis TaxID=1309795 RepID=UPI0028EA97B0|nr:metalloregulator ArsR/SmtB family transcription factor [uncultured Moraxella sp.]
MIDTFKALANDYRFDMLVWLKDPQTHFPMRTHEPDGFVGGVCVGFIAEKSGLAQSVVSNYLTTLKNANLIESKRIGKWTYYRYHQSAVNQFLADLNQTLA